MAFCIAGSRSSAVPAYEPEALTNMQWPSGLHRQAGADKHCRHEQHVLEEMSASKFLILVAQL